MSLITLATGKEFLQITHSQEDITLQILLDAVEDWIQKFCALRFNVNDAAASISEEPVSGGNRNLRPLFHPMLTVAEILDRDSSNAEIATTVWRYNKNRIWYRDGTYWGEGDERYLVSYTAGYTLATLPATLQLVILQLAHRAYNKRGGVSSDMVSGFSERWEKLLTADEITQLRAYSFNPVFS